MRIKEQETRLNLHEHDDDDDDDDGGGGGGCDDDDDDDDGKTCCLCLHGFRNSVILTDYFPCCYLL